MDGNADGRNGPDPHRADGTRYREQTPPAELEGLVTCTWSSHTRDGAPTRILPDACVDLIWASGVGAFVAGPDTRHQRAAFPTGTRVRAVRLRPGTAGVVLGLPASALRDQRVALVDLDGPLARAIAGVPGVTDDLGPDAPPDVAAVALVALVRERVADADDDRGRAHVRGGILARAGAARLRIATIADDLGYSERQLRRLSEDAFGYGPKTLHRVLRLQRFLRMAEAPWVGQATRTAGADDRTGGAVVGRTGGVEDRIGGTGTWTGGVWTGGAADQAGGRTGTDGGLARVAAHAGYADQPHLTRDCRALTGLAPAALLAERARRAPAI
ncbi:MAG: DUF6597 domain-containing transcriptional factor [Solirubrobacteraceae bacterium]